MLIGEAEPLSTSSEITQQVKRDLFLFLCAKLISPSSWAIAGHNDGLALPFHETFHLFVSINEIGLHDLQNVEMMMFGA